MRLVEIFARSSPSRQASGSELSFERPRVFLTYAIINGIVLQSDAYTLPKRDFRPSLRGKKRGLISQTAACIRA